MIMNVPLSDNEFDRFSRLIYELAGIHLSSAKKALVSGRLGRRLRHHALNSYSEYYRLVTSGQEPAEQQVLVDLLTTNETYFFREPRHFEFLREQILPHHRGGEFKVWSAACSSGQEPYTLAMVLADRLGHGRWSLLGTDISSQVLDKARRGVYTLAEARHIPAEYLKRYCMKGVREQQGNFAIERRLREAVNFRQLNLNGAWEMAQKFDLIMLRNVMIYFERDTKARLIERLANQLAPGGHLIIGHSETLNGVSERFRTLSPSIYQLK